MEYFFYYQFENILKNVLEQEAWQKYYPGKNLEPS